MNYDEFIQLLKSNSFNQLFVFQGTKTHWKWSLVDWMYNISGKTGGKYIIWGLKDHINLEAEKTIVLFKSNKEGNTYGTFGVGLVYKEEVGTDRYWPEELKNPKNLWRYRIKFYPHILLSSTIEKLKNISEEELSDIKNYFYKRDGVELEKTLQKINVLNEEFVSIPELSYNFGQGSLHALNKKNGSKFVQKILSNSSHNMFKKEVVSMKKNINEDIDAIISRKKQVILYGPPGTGKTWISLRYISEREERNSERITFHQSYSYEEFIEGFKPIANDEGMINYVVEDGIFKKVAINSIYETLKEKEGWDFSDYTNKKKVVLEKLQKWKSNKSNSYKLKELFSESPKFYILIDEINRGNISKIFGELITLIETDKRLGEENSLIVKLPYSKEPFAVPPNLYIIATMNTADRSIALLDIALRRRFGFIEVEPNPELLSKSHLLDVWKNSLSEQEFGGVKKEINKLFSELGDEDFFVALLSEINRRIALHKNRDHKIGHSYFMKVKSIEDLEFVWYHEIIPLLTEYFYHDWESLEEIIPSFVEKKGGETSIKYVESGKLIESLKSLISNEER